MDAITAKQQHVDALTAIMARVASRMQSAPITEMPGRGTGHPNFDPDRECIRIHDVALDLQTNEGPEGDDGTVTPNIATSAINAFELALQAVGAEIHPGREASHDFKWTPKTISVGGMVTFTSIEDMGLSGRGLKEKLSLLTHPIMENAARQALEGQMFDVAAENMRLRA